MKRIALIHDLSGLGRSSLGVALPIVSRYGFEGCALPTAVLSSITGYFDGWHMTPLTDQMRKSIRQWKDLNVNFSAVYSGFLASPEQADIVLEFFDTFCGCLKVVDPVFADNGEIYSCFDENMVERMRGLIKYADAITPNITEAIFLTKEGVLDDCLAKLRTMTSGKIVITGVIRGDEIHTIYDDRCGNVGSYGNNVVRNHYPGTGDIFASVLTAKLLQGDTLSHCVRCAADFVYEALVLAETRGEPCSFGVPFELVP